MSELTLKSGNDQSNLKFHEGMVARMETAFFSYGDYRKNYRGRYNRHFMLDTQAVMAALVGRYKTQEKSTTAKCNAVLAALERLSLYLFGGKTRGGVVDAGNTEYLMDAANFCLGQESRIWMADLTWKPLQEVMVGDKIIGFTEEPITNNIYK